MNRVEFAKLIVKRIKESDINFLAKSYANSGKINFLIIDDLLPVKLVSELNNVFPEEKLLNHKNTLQENKYTSVSFSNSHEIIEECIYAFHQKIVIDLISKITGIKDLKFDNELYAAGISSMSKGCFLNPHIDNSHDRELKNYRRLNLLFYVSKNWQSNDGGELVLYPDGVGKKEVSIGCNFNRLVIFKTDKVSYHSVKKIKSNEKRRKCITNYYFTETSPEGYDYYHSTSFIGFRNEYFKDAILKLNSFSRTFTKKLVYRITKKSISTNHHKKIS